MLNRTTPDAAGHNFFARLPDLGNTCLGNHNFGDSFFADKPDRNGNIRFLASSADGGDPEPFVANLLCEVGSAQEGTHFGAAPPKRYEVFDDKGSKSYRHTIAARALTGAPQQFLDEWVNSMSVVDSVRGAHEGKEDELGEKWDVNEALHSSEGASAPPNIMLLRLDPTYVVQENTGMSSPRKNATSGSPRKRLAKVGAAAAVDGDDDAMGEPEHAEAAEHKAPGDRCVGDTYPPDMLPDHRGPFFQHVHARLVQNDYRDTDDTLIAPWERGVKLVEGTVILVSISLVNYVIPYTQPKDGKSGRKVYHLLVNRLKVLDRGNGPAFAYAAPAAPTPATPSSPVKQARNTAADNAFDNFAVSPESPKPAKKTRRS